MAVRVTGDDRLLDYLSRLEEIGSPEFQDKIVAAEAAETLSELIEATPKKWFGQVRGAWHIQKPAAGMRVVRNDNRVMFFLEHGTNDHGPKTAKALFIPLTRRAAVANKQGRASGGSFGGGHISLTRETVRKGEKKHRSSVLEYGVDYVLAKRVRGIKPRHIAKKQRLRTGMRLSFRTKTAIRNHLR